MSTEQENPLNGTDTADTAAAAGSVGQQVEASSAEVAGVDNYGIVMDIPVTLSMELGRTRISIRELLNLKSGSVVELQKMTDEPMDVLVNGTLVARGEAVVVDDRFGIRLTDVISPMERVKKL